MASVDTDNIQSENGNFLDQNPVFAGLAMAGFGLILNLIAVPALGEIVKHPETIKHGYYAVLYSLAEVGGISAVVAGAKWIKRSLSGR